MITCHFQYIHCLLLAVGASCFFDLVTRVLIAVFVGQGGGVIWRSSTDSIELSFCRWYDLGCCQIFGTLVLVGKTTVGRRQSPF